MNRWNPSNRRVAIQRLRLLGFGGPVQGKRHQYMTYGERRLTLFSNRDYSVRQVRILLRQAADLMGREVTAAEWNAL